LKYKSGGSSCVLDLKSSIVVVDLVFLVWSSILVVRLVLFVVDSDVFRFEVHDEWCFNL
jgi:hypothetical protein